jgi:hypothetical protein
MLIFLNSTKAILILSWALNFWNARVFVGRFFFVFIIITRQHMCLPVQWNSFISFFFSARSGVGGRGITREETKGEQSRGPTYLWCLSFFWWCWLLCRVVSAQGGASERERPRMREMFFLEGQPNDPEGPRFPIRIRAEFTAGHKINRKLRLNP